MNPSLRLRLTLWYTAAIIGLFAIMFFSLNRFVTLRLRSSVDDSLFDYATRVQDVALASPPSNEEGYEQILSTAEKTRLGTGPFFGRIIGPDGRVTASFPDLPKAFDVLNPAQFASNVVQQEEYITAKISGSGKVRVYRRTLHSGDGSAIGVLEAGESLARVNQAITRLRATLAVEAGLGVLLALGIGYVVASRGLRPLEKVVSLAENIHRKNLSQRLPKERRAPEIERLAETFNSMLDRVDKAFAQERRFAADVSHELRTPLTSLRTQIEVLLMDPDMSDEVRPRLARLEKETSRLIQLTQNLLMLSQLEAHGHMEQTPVPLVPILHDVLHEAQIRSDGVIVRITREEPVTVRGDAILLKQAFLNVVDNALKYTSRKGFVEIGLLREQDSAKVFVKDNGIGIPREALPHIFEPFYRAEKSRGKVTGGVGLGLTIAKTVVERLSGQITVESVEGQGTTVTISLPALPA